MISLIKSQQPAALRQLLLQGEHSLLNSLTRTATDFTSIGTSASRKERNRFYKNVTVTPVDLPDMSKSYEINLDKRKLKTPGGKPFMAPNELIAHMCAFEWKSQQNTIKLHSMHLNSLSNTCADNPNKLTKLGIINDLLEYLHTDTVLFFDSNSVEKLEVLQETKWRPIVTWFNHKL